MKPNITDDLMCTECVLASTEEVCDFRLQAIHSKQLTARMSSAFQNVLKLKTEGRQSRPRVPALHDRQRQTRCRISDLTDNARCVGIDCINPIPSLVDGKVHATSTEVQANGCNPMPGSIPGVFNGSVASSRKRECQ